MTKLWVIVALAFSLMHPTTPTQREPGLSPPTLPYLYEHKHAPLVVPMPAPKEIIETVYITSYSVGDGYGTGITTSTGLNTSHFQVNAEGWYTYKGMLVVGAATTLCLRVKCIGTHHPFPKDYRIYNLKDKVTLIIKGKRYLGIVLDSCGACMYRINNEKYQRYDIFVKKNPMGKILGSLVVEE
jgi:hypothetical protein